MTAPNLAEFIHQATPEQRAEIRAALDEAEPKKRRRGRQDKVAPEGSSPLESEPAPVPDTPAAAREDG